MSNKIANKNYCHSLTDVYIGGLDRWCPTYDVLVGTNKFNISGEYSGDQLVKEGDISVKSKVTNHGIIYGEWDITSRKSLNTGAVEYFLLYKITNILLYTPKKDITFNVRYIIEYNNGMTIGSKNGTISFTHKASDGTTAQKVSTVCGSTLTNCISLTLTESSIRSVKLFLTTGTGLSDQPNDGVYEYRIIGKELDNIQRSVMDIRLINFSLSNVVTSDLLTQKQSGDGVISVRFNLPTGSTISSTIKDITIDPSESNMVDGVSKSTTINSSMNMITYNHTLVHDYGVHKYKVDYIHMCYHLNFKDISLYKKIYLIAPLEVNSGISLTNLIDE